MKKFLAVFCLTLVMMPTAGLAQQAPGPVSQPAINPCTIEAVKDAPTDKDKATALPKCVNQIYVWSLGIAALLAFLMMIIGGYTYMTAAGNAERTSKGAEIIWGAVIGLALLFGAYLLLNTINPHLVNFNLDSLEGINQTLPTPTAPRQP